jgi:hypothetical protein
MKINRQIWKQGNMHRTLGEEGNKRMGYKKAAKLSNVSQSTLQDENRSLGEVYFKKGLLRFLYLILDTVQITFIYKGLAFPKI